MNGVNRVRYSPVSAAFNSTVSWEILSTCPLPWEVAFSRDYLESKDRFIQDGLSFFGIYILRFNHVDYLNEIWSDKEICELWSKLQKMTETLCRRQELWRCQDKLRDLDEWLVPSQPQYFIYKIKVRVHFPSGCSEEENECILKGTRPSINAHFILS